MNYNIDKKTLHTLQNFFSKYNFIEKVMLFGSRAKGNHSDKSDIDLCIFSSTMRSNQLSKLRFELDELPIFYKIDLVHFESVDNDLQNRVLKEGKSLYIEKN